MAMELSKYVKSLKPSTAIWIWSQNLELRQRIKSWLFFADIYKYTLAYVRPPCSLQNTKREGEKVKKSFEHVFNAIQSRSSENEKYSRGINE